METAMRSFTLVQTFVATLTLVLALPGQARAQACNVSDGLDAGTICGSGPFVQLHQNAFKQPTVGICWRDCGVDTTAPYTGQWSALAPMLSGTPPAPSCAWYSTSLTLFQGNTIRWSGRFFAAYSRTWMEVDNAGLPLQVYRYLVNGDMTPVTATPGPCATPACSAPNGNLVRFTGYIDYAQYCQSGIPGGGLVEHAWMITHGCDAIDHQVGYPRAGAFHNNRFYSFVGPAAGFAVGAGGAIEVGTSNFEAIRRWDAIVMPAKCNFEERLLNATFSANTFLCMCGVGPANWYQAFVSLAGSLGTTATPYAGSDPFRSFPIGQWTNAAVFPGVEQVKYTTNDLRYQECTGNPPRFEYYFGVTTAGGFQAFQVSPVSPPNPLPLMFIDQGNSMIFPGVIPTRNRPYRTDHILNLNL
jgi:hypothetical protein